MAQRQALIGGIIVHANQSCKASSTIIYSESKGRDVIHLQAVDSNLELKSHGKERKKTMDHSWAKLDLDV